ncbi:hypothetical protein BFV94_3960 [Alteromonas macleodii]|uniref:Uncharacterized protein n=1 Tax=Alteromonas macleodii TaxID=28108 RepID=A0AB36FPL6_ALTMA|nr:hypothetical protein BFV95_3969 [Alteromonas macleodii]OES26542.1 hypothetical protein BFV94_3960 [Alteromonas macleodii]OES27316.1 hypothetical protein BFV93_3957 [Alteromonas macleodii]OES39560.1 hypothetical protein BFV96_3950 [Alteromonas macleodii]
MLSGASLSQTMTFALQNISQRLPALAKTMGTFMGHSVNGISH